MAAPPESAGARRRPVRGLAAWVSLTVLAATLLVALCGAWFAPHPPAANLGVPYSTPDATYRLGLDYIGEDVFSRILWGGRTVVVLGLLATALAYALGGAIGLLAGYGRGVLDSVLMRGMDVLLAFPPILFLLMLGTGFGNSLSALVIGIAIVHLPGVARIVRTAAAEVAVRGFVEAAVARGDHVTAILRREILPNIWGPIVADAGPRFTVSILLVAAVNFLGLGIAPPAADWALMISENRSGLLINPASVLGPAVMIGVLTVSLNVFADTLARSLGQSTERQGVP